MEIRKTVDGIIDEIVNLKISFKARINKANRHLLSTNKDLKGVLEGKRCFVVGNGPSLKSQDLSLLKDEFVFTVNQIARHQQFDAMKTNVHFWADPGFFKEDELGGHNSFLEQMKNVKRNGNDPICFFPVIASQFIKKHQLDKEINVRYFWPEKYFTKSCKEIDFTTVIPGFHTVVDYAIILAIYMGAKEIYLLGCDCTGIMAYIQSKNNEKIDSYAFDFKNEKDAEQTKKMYTAVQSENMFNNFYMVLRQYRQLKEYCEKIGVKLVNCTEGGILDSIPREKYEDVVKP